MKKLGKMLRKSIVFCFVMFVICAFIYPFALTGISQLTMKNKANGNLIDKNGLDRILQKTISFMEEYLL